MGGGAGSTAASSPQRCQGTASVAEPLSVTPDARLWVLTGHPLTLHACQEGREEPRGTCGPHRSPGLEDEGVTQKRVCRRWTGFMKREHLVLESRPHTGPGGVRLDSAQCPGAGGEDLGGGNSCLFPACPEPRAFTPGPHTVSSLSICLCQHPSMATGHMIPGPRLLASCGATTVATPSLGLGPYTLRSFLWGASKEAESIASSRQPAHLTLRSPATSHLLEFPVCLCSGRAGTSPAKTRRAACSW